MVKKRVQDSLQDIAQPVSGGALHRVLLEEVMFHELHSTRSERARVLLRPYNVFGLLEDWTTVLDDEVEFGIQL